MPSVSRYSVLYPDRLRARVSAICDPRGLADLVQRFGPALRKGPLAGSKPSANGGSAGAGQTAFETPILSPSKPAPVTLYKRTLFLSDLHLGAPGARADLVLDFLSRHQAETYFLVGDILDVWQPLARPLSSDEHKVLEHLRLRADQGAQVIYLVGNHDPDPAKSKAVAMLPGHPVRHAVHHTADGRRFLVVHGDAQDSRLFQAHVLTRLGSVIDRLLRRLDAVLRRDPPGVPVHQRSAVELVLSWANWLLYPSRTHERRLVDLACDGGHDGVICGHFHMARLHDRHGRIYANCGDWVDSFTALGENHDGSLNLLGGRHAMAQDQPSVLAGAGALA
jgi:UDP-2,3-diacylglucosamine pyrophosphatase LpxH